jgi:hypothetical protein
MLAALAPLLKLLLVLRKPVLRMLLPVRCVLISPVAVVAADAVLLLPPLPKLLLSCRGRNPYSPEAPLAKPSAAAAVPFCFLLGEPSVPSVPSA